MPKRERVVGPDLLARLPLPDYGAEANKDARGKLLVVAGSLQLPGAAILPSIAALRVGCGTVRTAITSSVATAVGVAVPELMIVPLPEGPAGMDGVAAAALLDRQLPFCRAVVLGPGMDNSPGAADVIVDLIKKCPLPMVIDAEAIRVCAGCLKDLSAPAAPRVLTPHVGEMAALLDLPPDDVAAVREDVAREFAQDHKCVLVLKGAQTLIAGPDGQLARNTAGTRGLGTAGSGDVLAGIVGGLLAQGVEPYAAAVWGVHLHALAGEMLAKELGEDGLMASDLLPRLPLVLRELRRKSSRRSNKATKAA